MLEKQPLYKLLVRYVSETITKEELLELRTLVNLSDDEELSVHVHRLWNEYKPAKLPENTLMDDIFRQIKSRTRKQRIRLEIRRKVSYALGITAALLISFLSVTSLFLLKEKKQYEKAGEREMTVRSERGQKVRVTLPDGSQVRLNAASMLQYKLNYGDSVRKVAMKGEGFFEVKKDPHIPFIVQTQYLDIEVLGTSFNIYAYEEEQIVETTLITGKVKIMTHTFPVRVAYLNPDEKALYHIASGDLRVEKTDKRIETAWLRGALVFRSVPLRDILYKLERQYGVTIHLDNKNIEDDVFTGTFDSEYISDIMKILRAHYSFQYKIVGDHIYITSPRR